MKKIINGFIDVFKNKKLLAKLFLFYLGSYLLFFFIYRSFLKTLDNLEGIGAEGINQFNFTYLFLLIKEGGSLPNIISSLMVALILIYFIYSQIIVKRFTENITGQANKVKNFWKVLFSWLYLIPPAAFTVISTLFLYNRSRDLATINPNSAITMEIFSIIIMVLLGVFLVSLLDTTRIVSIFSGINSFKANIIGYKFVFRNYLRFFAVYLSYGILFFIFLIIFNKLMVWTEGIRWNMFLILILFHLLFFFIQLVLKFSVFSIEFQIINSGIRVEAKPDKKKADKKPLQREDETNPL